MLLLRTELWLIKVQRYAVMGWSVARVIISIYGCKTSVNAFLMCCGPGNCIIIGIDPSQLWFVAHKVLGSASYFVRQQTTVGRDQFLK